MSQGNFGEDGRAWAGPQSRRGGETSCRTDQVEPAAARPPFHLCGSFLLGPPFYSVCGSIWVGLGRGRKGSLRAVCTREIFESEPAGNRSFGSLGAPSKSLNLQGCRIFYQTTHDWVGKFKRRVLYAPTQPRHPSSSSLLTCSPRGLFPER